MRSVRRRGSGIGHGRHQRLGVRMLRRGEQRLGGRRLDDASDVHHRHALADVLDHRQVVRDEEHGEAERVLQLEEQVEDLRLDRHVEGRHRLVGDDEPRVERERARDADPLALAAGERVRVALHVLRPQADQPQQLDHAVGPLLRRAHAVHQERLADDVEERHPRVERGERVLEDHLHLPAQHAQLVLGHRGDVDDLPAVGQQDLARRRGDRAQDAARRRGLAAAAFAHQRERLALAHEERDVVDRLDLADGLLQQAAADREVLLQAADVQQHGAVGGGGGGHRLRFIRTGSSSPCGRRPLRAAAGPRRRSARPGTTRSADGTGSREDG